MEKMTSSEVRERLGLTPGQFRTWVASLQLDPELASGNTHLFTPDDVALLAYAKPLRQSKVEVPWEEIRRRFEVEHPGAKASRKGVGVGPELAEVTARLDRLTAALPEKDDLHAVMREAVLAALADQEARALVISEQADARMEKFSAVTREAIDKLTGVNDAQATIIRLQAELLDARAQIAQLQAPPAPKGLLARLLGR